MQPRFSLRFLAIPVSIFMLALGASAQPEKLSRSFAEITKKVEPAVVSIDTKGKVVEQPIARSTPAPGGGDEDIMNFLRRQMQQQRPVQGVGSGFIVDKTGYILTNAHVVDDAARITVKLDSGEEYLAKVVGTDEETDVAVLKIEAGRDLPTVSLGDSEKAEVGDWVLAIGSPFGLAKTVTAGIISTTRRETPYGSAFQRFIQTDAAINRGNSGGPLVNLDGEVIGINSQIATSTGDYNGIGFALPSREALNVYSQIIKTGKVKRGYLGVLLDSVKSEFASVYGMKDGRGAIVTDIRDKQGPAALAGLKAGDVITDFNGQRLDSAQDMIAKVAATQPNQSITLGYLRETGSAMEARTVTIKLAERPTNRPMTIEADERRPLPLDGSKDTKPFGITLNDLTPVLSEKYKLGLEKGVIVREISPASFIADVKNSVGVPALSEGDLIQRINRVSVTSVQAFNDVASKLNLGDPVVLHVLSFNPSLRSTQLKVVQFTVR